MKQVDWAWLKEQFDALDSKVGEMMDGMEYQHEILTRIEEKLEILVYRAMQKENVSRETK